MSNTTAQNVLGTKVNRRGGFTSVDQNEFATKDVRDYENGTKPSEDIRRFDLEDEDGLLNRRREFVSREKRMELLDVEVKHCSRCDCGLKLYYRRDLAKGKQKLCIGCLTCTICHESLLRCQCEEGGKLVETKPLGCCNRTRRVMWRLMTLFGLLESVYHTFFEGILATVLFTLLISYFVQQTNNITVIADNSTTIIPTFNVNVSRTMIAGMYVIAMILLMLTMIKSVPFIANTLTGLKCRHRVLNRIRYDELEMIRLNANPTQSDTRVEYFSDDQRAGMEDPDTAYMNLTQADRRSRGRICCRRLCIC